MRGARRVPARGPAPPPMPAPPRAGRIPSRTRSRHADVHRLLAEGRSQAHALQEPGLSRTVRRFARAARPEELLASDGTGKQASILDEHAAHLRESGGTQAAPTPPSSGPSSATADTRRPDLRPPVPRPLPRNHRRPRCTASGIRPNRSSPRRAHDVCPAGFEPATRCREGTGCNTRCYSTKPLAAKCSLYL
jgi:hypothetical protein